MLQHVRYQQQIAERVQGRLQGEEYRYQAAEEKRQTVGGIARGHLPVQLAPASKVNPRGRQQCEYHPEIEPPGLEYRSRYRVHLLILRCIDSMVARRA
jgi:hypothetical protein